MSKRTETVVYRLIGLKRDPNSGRIKAPIILTIPTKDTIITPNGKEKAIKFSPGTLVTADGGVADIKSEISFKSGYLFVKPDDINLYDFVETCNWNKSNPNRKKSVTPIFERVDEGKTKREALEEMIKEQDAMNIVAEMEFDDMYACALALKINTNQEAEAIKHDLMRATKTQPEWFTQNSLEDIKLKAKFLKAINLNIIKMDRHSRSFSWGHIEGGKAIARAPVGQDDIIEWFLDWCMDNQENGVYTEIMDKVEKEMKKNKSKLSDLKEAVA